MNSYYRYCTIPLSVTNRTAHRFAVDWLMIDDWSMTDDDNRFRWPRLIVDCSGLPILIFLVIVELRLEVYRVVINRRRRRNNPRFNPGYFSSQVEYEFDLSRRRCTLVYRDINSVGFWQEETTNNKEGYLRRCIIYLAKWIRWNDSSFYPF